MRIPLSWLSDYVDLPESADSLADQLTNAGLEVTSVERLGIDGAELVWDRDKVVVGKILEVRPHPDADRLVLATVDYGREPKVVVTGAPNLRPLIGEGDLTERNLTGLLILEGGTYLDPYKDGKPTRLKGRKLRGIYNDAMLCSPAELGLGEDHDRILIIENDDLYSDCVPGTPLQDVLGDVILDIDIIPNIARCASMVGTAREVAALTGATLRTPDCSVTMEGEPIADRVRVTTSSPELNPRFVALLIEDIEQGPAPFWMQHRLRLAGQRPIDIIVDVSNYVMLEIGQPNHSFDLELLQSRADGDSKNGSIHLHTRLANDGETLSTLDGGEHQLRAYNMLVTDSAGVLSLAGIMGGAESQIRPTTRSVLLEAASWNFINIRKSSRRLGLLTDAAFRFSRGVHPSQALLGAQRAAELLRRLAGGRVAEGVVDCYPLPAPAVSIDLEADYVRKLSGLDLEPAEIGSLLERLEFGVEQQQEALRVTVPDHRLDIEGPHDLVEEICRMYGYDRIPSTVLGDVLPTQRGNPELEREERIKDGLVRLGLQEVITYRLTTPGAESRVRIEDDDETYVRLLNPSTNERVVLRHSLLASVLEIAAANSRYQDRICIFEIGRTYLTQTGQQLPTTHRQLAIVMTGRRRRPDWQNGDGPDLDFFDLKGVLQSLACDLKLDRSAARWRFVAGEQRSFRPGHTVRIESGGVEVGIGGEIHPLVREGFEFRLDEGRPVLAAVLDLEAILPAMSELFSVDDVAPYPAIREDLALVVDRQVAAGDVETALRQAGGPLLVEIELFDVYEGDNLEPDEKSLAYHLTLRSAERTLDDRDADRVRNRILEKLAESVGARLR